uniref:long-chain-fatty-acid--CoA ligase n=1 Tax=Lepisosteus oculatus TaxID=7918 RepID=W5N5U4_LEPOC
CKMHIIFAILAGLAILPLLFRSFFPYIVQDWAYMANVMGSIVKFAKRSRRNPPYLVLDRFFEQVQRHPDKPFIVSRDHTYSFRETDKLSNKFARVLRIHADLKEGNTVALYIGNEPAFIFIWLALAKIGCTVALLNCNIRSKSLLHCFSCCDAKTLIAASELTDAVVEVLPFLREQKASVFILSAESTIPGTETLIDKIDQASDEPIPQSERSSITMQSPAVFIYTSGTTGLPKAAVINQKRLLSALVVLSSVGVHSDDVVYVNLPLYHSAAFLIGFIGSIEAGSTIVLSRKFSVSQFWEDCRKYNVTVMQYIGETMRYLCNTPKKDDDRDHKVRIAIGNGLRADVWREFLTRFGSVHITEFYGATEGNIGFINYVGKIGAVGRVNYLHKKLFRYALIKYDIEKDEPVRDSQGLCLEASKGETGLLVAKITNIAPFSGYAKNHQQTDRKKLRDVFQKGDLYYNSGDLLRIDQDNFIYFQDRVGDTFRWKGENVSTTEVADIFAMVDCIEEANVYGVQVPGHEGKIGMAAVILKQGRQFDCCGMFNHVVSFLPSYARPRFVRVQNSLEVTGTFKQKKVKLVAEGFNPAVLQDPLYFLDDKEKRYVPMTQEIYDSILSMDTKL